MERGCECDGDVDGERGAEVRAYIHACLPARCG